MLLLHGVEAHPSEHVCLFCPLFSNDLTSEIAQVVAHLGVLDGHLLVKVFLLAEASREHVDLLSQLVVFKLILICLASDVLIALLSELLKLTMLAVLQLLDHLIGFVELLAQVPNQTVLVLFQVLSVSFEGVHQASQGLVLVCKTR